jgi:DNA-binding CsgD family transcriptional regulator
MISIAPGDDNLAEFTRTYLDRVWREGIVELSPYFAPEGILFHGFSAGVGAVGMEPIHVPLAAIESGIRAQLDGGPCVDFSILFLHQDGERVAGAIRRRFLHRNNLMGRPATGRAIDSYMSFVAVFCRGKIVEWWHSWNADELDAALRFAPPTVDRTKIDPSEVPGAQPPPPLSPRQKLVAGCIARGLSDKEIAAELAISIASVRTHLRALFKRFSTRSRRDLATRLRAF